jgi:hydroxyacylglutathione hydrolase
MSPLSTKLITSGIYAVNNKFVNLYLIQDKDSYIAVDAGFDEKMVAQELKKLNIKPEKISAVFLTHSDQDHIAGLALFNHARIYISQDEVQLLNGKMHRRFIFDNHINFKYDNLKDNQIVKVGNIIIKAISTPGHTPGSMCFLVNGKYLFTGDTLSLKDGKVGLFNNFFNMDTETQKLSIKKISHLENVQFIFTAHYGYTTDFSKAIEKWKI